MLWNTPTDPWPELLPTVVGRVTTVEPADGDEPPRAWVDTIGPLRLPLPSLAERMAPGVRVRLTYHRAGGLLTVVQVRELPPEP
jgi:hypothetical protein